jgi:hypothetical protein
MECVIHRYRVCGLDEFESFYLVEDSVDFILGRLAFIENQCDEHKGENPHSIEGLAWRWNRKRARRRLRRWMNEHNRPDLILPNERLRAIARQAFEHDNSQEPEIDIIKHLVEGGEGWGILSSYFEAKMAQPLLIIGEQVPAG